jgi:trehalose 6-phosphate synthase
MAGEKETVTSKRRKWDKNRLYNLVQEKLGDSLFIVVSNREPYVHSMSGDKITYNTPVSGLTQALDPVMRASKGSWIAQGSGDADKQVVDENDRILVPPDNPEYTLRRVWLTQEEVEGFYLGFSNEGLWPLCHVTFTAPKFVEPDWETYRKVNQIFADVVVQEVGNQKAVVLVQDYHFALLSCLLKERNPDLTIGQFWHIPWPPFERFRTCPWHEEILDGMLGNDLMGFHVQSFCDNFMETVEKLTDAKVDRSRAAVTYHGKTTLVQPFPISVDFENISREAGVAAVEQEIDKLKRELNLDGKFVGIGMDRIDYTKGIPQRLQALDKLLEDNPEYREKVIFIQAGMPSRTQIDSYKNLMQQIDEMAENINNKYSTDSWKPIVMLTRQLTSQALNALRRLSHFCIVSSLHDGMNLIAKEYVASRNDEDGVLILSKHTGAAVELSDALLINPFAISEFASKIKEALEMPESERKQRMKNMREIVATNNIYRWGADNVSRLISIAGN